MLRPRWQPADSSCCLELFFGSCLNESRSLARGACPPTDRMVLSCCTGLGCCCAGVLCSMGCVCTGCCCGAVGCSRALAPCGRVGRWFPGKSRALRGAGTQMILLEFTFFSFE